MKLCHCYLKASHLVAHSVQNLRGRKSFYFKQQYFVWDNASQSSKLQDMLKIWGTWISLGPPNLRLCSHPTSLPPLWAGQFMLDCF